MQIFLLKLYDDRTRDDSMSYRYVAFVIRAYRMPSARRLAFKAARALTPAPHLNSTWPAEDWLDESKSFCGPIGVDTTNARAGAVILKSSAGI